jgi:hypothetical protein
LHFSLSLMYRLNQIKSAIFMYFCCKDHFFPDIFTCLHEIDDKMFILGEKMLFFLI